MLLLSLHVSFSLLKLCFLFFYVLLIFKNSVRAGLLQLISVDIIDFDISMGFWNQSLINTKRQLYFNKEVIKTISPQKFQKIFGEEYLLFLYCSHSESANIY